MKKYINKKPKKWAMTVEEFSKKLDDASIIVNKLEIKYAKYDSRVWTAVVNPNMDNIIINYHINKEELDQETFDVFASNRIVYDLDLDSVIDTIVAIASPEKVDLESLLELNQKII